ncbi:hypothetical protein PG996_014386 [Apiospora saccharicola]|uniref:Uncharacterized protein n=1 Tax=Apiospora saccharicola TaxID=335842 RepID=A0ABR1TIB7_9PEZI
MPVRRGKHLEDPAGPSRIVAGLGTAGLGNKHDPNLKIKGYGLCVFSIRRGSLLEGLTQRRHEPPQHAVQPRRVLVALEQLDPVDEAEEQERAEGDELFDQVDRGVDCGYWICL